MADNIRESIDLLPHPLPTEANHRLLLFAMRRVAAHGLDDAHAAHALLCGFGMSFRRPLILLRALMAEASRIAHRRILVAPCCCPRMTEAEATMLTAIQASRSDPHHVHDNLAALLGVDNCLGTLSSAQALAQAFEDLGKPLAIAADGTARR